LPRAALENSFVQEQILNEDHNWMLRCMNTPPEDALIPMPESEAIKTYHADFRAYTSRVDDLVAKLKTQVYEAVKLARLASHVPANGAILEVGSGIGGSLAAMAVGSDPSVRLISVDHFGPYTEITAGSPKGITVTEGDEKIFWETAQVLGYRERVRQIKKLSCDGAADIENESCDLVFIDANHSYETTLDDLQRYWPKVRPGGILIGHDFSTRFPGVIRAVENWEERSRVSVFQGTTIFYARKDM